MFRRLTRKIVLTDEGALFHEAVSCLLAELTREAERLRGQKSGGRLTISTGISFACKWLGSRLHRLIARHPELDIHLDITDPDADLSNEQINAAVCYGHGRYPHVVAERILEETLTPVCSPGYRAEMGGLLSVESLAECTLLHEDRLLRNDRMLANWERWFEIAGVDGIPGGAVAQFTVTAAWPPKRPFAGKAQRSDAASWWQRILLPGGWWPCFRRYGSSPSGATISSIAQAIEIARRSVPCVTGWQTSSDSFSRTSTDGWSAQPKQVIPIRIPSPASALFDSE